MPGVATSHIWAGARLGIADLLARSRARLLVFRYPAAVPAPIAHPCPGHDDWVPANAANIESLFSGDPRRCDLFLQFLNAGCTGLFLVRDGAWLCHGWYSDPGSVLPAHLPPACRRRGGYWVFFCRVREGFRGQGYYKGLLLKMVSSIRARDPLAQIDIDTESNNFPSRHAIQACGFLPRGIIVSYKLGIPSKWRMVVGQWYSDLPHPPYEASFPQRPRRSFWPARPLQRARPAQPVVAQSRESRPDLREASHDEPDFSLSSAFPLASPSKRQPGTGT